MIDLLNLDIAIEGVAIQLSQSNFTIADLVEIEASLDHYSRALAKLAREAQKRKRGRRVELTK